MESRKPKIRFKGFTDPWEQRKLGELMDVTSVRRVHQEDWTDEGVRFLRARDLVAFAKNEPIDDPLFISKEMYQEYSAQSGKVSVGDLLVTGVGTIGVPWLVTSENPIYFKDGNIIWFKNAGEIDGEFFYHSFIAGTIQSFINEAAGIGTVGTYTIETGKKTPIWLPAKQEQCCISAFMTRLDNLITLHQRKLNALKKVKKSLLEKMFPKPGEFVPEIRFKGFTDPWEQRKLGELILLGGSGGTPSATNPDYYGGEIPFLGISDIEGRDITHTSKTLTEEGLRNSVAWLVPAGAVSLAMYASVGKVGIIRQDTATSQAFYNMVFEDIAIRDFVFTRLEKADADFEWEPYISTGTQRNLNADKVKAFTIAVPNSCEATEISRYFANLDRLITLHQRKLNALKNVKKSLLEKMFV